MATVEAATGRVLVVEDDDAIADVLRRSLRAEGHEVRTAGDWVEALRAAEEFAPDLVVLDLGLPRLDGLEVAKRLRADSDVPILMLTARTETEDRVEGLDSGADDYLPKPFERAELLARIRAILRRAGPVQDSGSETPEAETPDTAVIERGRLRMDPARHQVTWAGKPVSLTVTEFLILEALAARPGVIKSRNQLMDAAYGEHIYVDDRTIDSHIKRLRKKFKQSDDEFDMIETLYGVGYRFKEA